MKNPWLDIRREAPFILIEDLGAVEDFNVRAGVDYRIDLRSVPEPFIGYPDAPVVLLNANPGFSDAVNAEPAPIYTEAALRNLRHECPFHLLDPRVCTATGIDWWERKLRSLVEACGREQVARRVLCVELHGYHSRKFDLRLRVPSDEYNTTLVRAAMARSALLLVMRGHRHWTNRIPELSSYGRVSRVRNWQNPSISERNVGLRVFEEAVRILR